MSTSRGEGSRPVAAGVVMALPRDPLAARVARLVALDPEAALALVTDPVRLLVVRQVLEEELGQGSSFMKLAGPVV